jgi:hypothetical protein
MKHNPHILASRHRKEKNLNFFSLILKSIFSLCGDIKSNKPKKRPTKSQRKKQKKSKSLLRLCQKDHQHILEEVGVAEVVSKCHSSKLWQTKKNKKTKNKDYVTKRKRLKKESTHLQVVALRQRRDMTWKGSLWSAPSCASSILAPGDRRGISNNHKMS